MKKMLLFLCLFVSLVSIFGCSADHNQQRTSVNFYYKTSPIDHISETGVIAVEVRITKASPDDYQLILEQYLNGSRSSNCISPFPAGTALKSFSIADSTASIVLSPHLTMLSDSDLTVACICLARTVFDMTEVTTVQISAQNNLLRGEPYIVITDTGFETKDIVADILAND